MGRISKLVPGVPAFSIAPGAWLVKMSALGVLRGDRGARLRFAWQYMFPDQWRRGWCSFPHSPDPTFSVHLVYLPPPLLESTWGQRFFGCV